MVSTLRLRALHVSLAFVLFSSVNAQGHLGGNESAYCTSAQNFVYLGCYGDAANGAHAGFAWQLIGSQYPNDLHYWPGFNTNALTIEACVQGCRGHGFRYAALYNAYECFCGTIPPTVQTPGSNPSNNATMNECHVSPYPCTGNSNEWCGFNNAADLWGDPTFPNVTLANEGTNYQYFGCFANVNPDDLYYETTASSTQDCFNQCSTLGYPYAGMSQLPGVSNNCQCGTEIQTGSLSNTTASCSSSCGSGDVGVSCGGHDYSYITIYRNPDLQGCYQVPYPGGVIAPGSGGGSGWGSGSGSGSGSSTTGGNTGSGGSTSATGGSGSGGSGGQMTVTYTQPASTVTQRYTSTETDDFFSTTTTTTTTTSPGPTRTSTETDDFTFTATATATYTQNVYQTATVYSVSTCTVSAGYTNCGGPTTIYPTNPSSTGGTTLSTVTTTGGGSSTGSGGSSGSSGSGGSSTGGGSSNTAGTSTGGSGSSTVNTGSGSTGTATTVTGSTGVGGTTSTGGSGSNSGGTSSTGSGTGGSSTGGTSTTGGSSGSGGTSTSGGSCTPATVTVTVTAH